MDLTQKEFESILSKFQDNKELFNLEIDNFYLWSIVKENLFTKVLQRLYTGKKENILERVDFEKGKLIKQTIDFSASVLNFILILLTKKTSKKKKLPLIIFFIYSNFRFKNKDGKQQHPFSDHLIGTNDLYNCYVVEGCHGYPTTKNVPYKSNLKEEVLYFPGYVLGRLFKYKSKNVSTLKSKLLKIILDSFQEYPQLLEIIKDEFDKGLIERNVLKFRIQKFLATALFKKLEPKCILLHSYQGHLGTIGAAKSLAIPVIEFQHGVMNSFTRTYNWTDKIKVDRAKLLIPDKIFVWGQYWKDQLLSGGFWRQEDIFPSGYHRFDLMRDKYKKDEKKKLKDSLTYLYTTAEPIKNEAINFFNDVLKLAEEKKVRINIWIKLHPSEGYSFEAYYELEKRYPDHCKVFKHADKDLYDLFNETDIHLSVWSATIFESIGLGINTAILNLPWHDYLQNLIDKSYVRFIKCPENLIVISEMILDSAVYWNNWAQSTETLGNYFFSNDAIHNQKKYIDSLLFTDH